MLTTRFTELVGCSVPIQQAGMGAIASPELAAAVLVGALGLLVESPRSASDVGAAAGLILLGVIHVLYWWRPWPSRPRRAIVAAASMVAINFVCNLERMLS